MEVVFPESSVCAYRVSIPSILDMFTQCLCTQNLQHVYTESLFPASSVCTQGSLFQSLRLWTQGLHPQCVHTVWSVSIPSILGIWTQGLCSHNPQSVHRVYFLDPQHLDTHSLYSQPESSAYAHRISIPSIIGVCTHSLFPESMVCEHRVSVPSILNMYTSSACYPKVSVPIILGLWTQDPYSQYPWTMHTESLFSASSVNTRFLFQPP